MTKLHKHFALALLSCFLGVASAQPHSLEALASFFQGLKSPDLEMKNTAGQNLLSYGEWWIEQDVATMRRSFPILFAALEDSDPGIRLQASAFFSVVGPLRQKDGLEIFEGIVPQIIDKFDDPNPRVRGNVMNSLVLLEPGPPLEVMEPLLKKALKDPNTSVRGMAVYGWAKAAPASLEAAYAIANLLEETEDPEARRGLIQKLAFVKQAHPVIVAKLVEQLDKDSERLRMTTARVLGEIGPAAAAALPKLREIASDAATGEELRQQAEAALQSIER